MTDTPKPPMVVWLDRFADQGNEMGVYATVKTPLINDDNAPSFGPYVHLDQFLAEVERRLDLWRSVVIAGESQEITDKHFKEAALMIIKELKNEN